MNVKACHTQKKNKLAAEKWSLQDSHLKIKYGETAKAMSSVDISSLDENQKKKLIERHTEQLREEVIKYSGNNLIMNPFLKFKVFFCLSPLN